MKAEDLERKLRQHGFDHRQQIGFTNLLAASNNFPLCDAINRVDVAHPFRTIVIALMHRTDTDIAGQTIRFGCSAHADDIGLAARFGEPHPLRLVGIGRTQIVPMRHRNHRQPNKAPVVKYGEGAIQ